MAHFSITDRVIPFPSTVGLSTSDDFPKPRGVLVSGERFPVGRVLARQNDATGLGSHRCALHGQWLGRPSTRQLGTAWHRLAAPFPYLQKWQLSETSKLQPKGNSSDKESQRWTCPLIGCNPLEMGVNVNISHMGLPTNYFGWVPLFSAPK